MKNAAQQDKLSYINAVRGIGILLVVILHVSNATKALPESFRYIFGKGAFGVQLFFVASAFTLFLSYSGRVVKEGKLTSRNFFIRRFARISPMYYTAAIVYSIICFYIPAYNDGKPLSVWKVLANVLYVNGFIPGAVNYLPPGGWSVGVEMVFYCCVPFLFTRVKSFKSSLIWFGVLTAGAIMLKLGIRYILISKGVDYHGPESWFLYFWFPNQAAVFMLGIVLFFAMQKYKNISRQSAYTGLAVSVSLMIITAWFMRGINTQNIIPEHILLAMFFTVNIFFLSKHNVILFNNVITRFFGEISFSLYLVHFIVIYVLEDYFPLPANPYMQFAALLVLTLIVSSIISTLTYKLIELPGIKSGSNYIKRKSVKPALEPGI